MARPKSNPEKQDQSQSTKSEEVTFIWNRPSKEQVIVVRPAKVMFTDSGPMTDPREPAKRIKVKNGTYTTKDKDEIAFLTGLNEFNKKGIDGFSIVKKFTPEEELESMRKRLNISKEKLVELINQE